jgi:hypothetical protein
LDDPEGLGALVAALRRPEDLGPVVDGAVMAAVRAARMPLRVVVGGSAPTPAWARPQVARRPQGVWARAWRWIAEPRPVRVSPLGALAAAGLAIAAAFGVRRDAPRPVAGESATGEFPVATGEFAAAARTTEHAVAAEVSTGGVASVTRFLIVAPQAREVVLVGDFNDWDQRATPLVKVTGHGVWTVEVPLRPGRYSYAFLVDGQRWMPDPSAPRSVGDDFGRPSSVVTVRGGQA